MLKTKMKRAASLDAANDAPNNYALKLEAARRKKGIRVFLYIIPVLAFVFIFSYLPLWGWGYAFVDFKPGHDLLDSEFVGFHNFTVLFTNPVIRKQVFQSLANTLGIHFLGYLCMPLPMIFAIFLSELKSKKFRKVTQTVSTLPHFISWMIMYSITYCLLSNTGVMNTVLMNLGIIDEPINIMSSNKHVWIYMLVLQQWKGLGWSAIVYFSAISSIDVELNEAATIDGASRMQRIWHITVPHLIPTFFVLLIMSIGNMLSTGIDQYFIFGNAMNKEYSQVFDLYVYNLGIGSGNIDYGTAVGILKSFVAVILFSSANFLSKKVRGYGIA